jgi:hypothetical protein
MRRRREERTRGPVGSGRVVVFSDGTNEGDGVGKHVMTGVPY